MSDDDFIDAPPAGPNAWRELWERDRRYRPRGSQHEWFLKMARRLSRRALEPDAERQKNFNVVVLDLVGDLRRDIEAVQQALKKDLEAVQRDVRAADDALANDIRRVHELIPVAARRNDALIAALDQKIETLAARLRDVTNPPIAETERVHPSGTSGHIVPSSPRSEDLLYRRLEDSLRGSEASVREAVAPYVELARDHQPLLDAGCGRGELLVACRDANVAARGCDLNERSVADLRQRGFEVVLAGIPECFDGVADATLGSVAALHVVEHLPVETLFAFFAHAARVLRPGGLLMIETPNAESLLVGASEFWRDPTHLAPRHPAALIVLAREHGFEVAEVRAVHEFPEGTAIATSADDPPALRRVIDAINARLFAPQDLRLILRK